MYPEQITLEITTRCNLDCVMCPHGLPNGMPIKQDASDALIDSLLAMLDHMSKGRLNLCFGNGSVTADQELFGVAEWWAVPTLRADGSGKGDCEDYALLKRQILIKRGWPVSSLLMTVVRDEKGDGHAVLTARTAQGDFILDNKTSDLKLWSQTPYKFVMRQSYLNVKVWMSLDPKETMSPGPMAAVKTQR